jgi:iron complex outermembrane recepter protein
MLGSTNRHVLRSKVTRDAMWGGICLAGLVALSGACRAEDIDLTQRVAFQIPAQRLESALLEFAKQAHIPLSVNAHAVENVQAPALQATLPTGKALTLLLATSGLTYSTVGNTIAVGTVSSGDLSQDDHSREPRRTVQAAGSEVASAQEPTRGAAAAPELQEVVVTSQRREERLQKVPISISVLSGSEMDRSSVQGVSEALNAVPGVATTETYLGGGTNIVVRGVGAAFPLFTGPSAIAYYLDSVPFGLVKSAIGPDADAYDLERVEVLRGPQGTLYGSSALNGVVRVLTHDPNLNAFDLKARVSDSGTDSGGNNYRADTAINIPIIADKLAARAAIGYQHNSGWIDQPGRSNANDTNIGNYRLKLAAKPTDEFSVLLSAWSSRENSGAPDLGSSYDKNTSLLYQPTSTKYDAYGAKLGYEFPWFSVTSMTSYLDYKNEGNLGLDVPGFGVPDGLFFSQSKSNVASEEVNFNSSLETPWRWSAGGIYRHGTEYRYQTFTVLPVPAPYYVDSSKSYALYGELTRLLFDGKLELTAGLRHFHDDVDQRGQTGPGSDFVYASGTAEANTPRGVITWHLTDSLMTYASYSEGFRSGFPQDPPVLLAFPSFAAVKPDRLRNFEMGSKGTFLDGHLAYNASVYHMNWNDIQLQLFAPLNGVPYPAIANGAQAKGSGLDLALTFNWADFTLSPYVSWNDLKVSSAVLSGGTPLYLKGDRPSGSPETTAGVSADYLILAAGHNLHLAASANYTSPQTYRTVSGTTLLVQGANSVFITRASIAFDLTSQWTASVYGENLNNWHGTTAVMFPATVPDWDARLRPLTVGVQAEYRFSGR